MDVEKKYYATSLKALSLGECIRLGGGIPMGILSWILGRFLPPQGKMLIPEKLTVFEISKDDLSDTLRKRISELTEDFLRNNFKILSYQKMPYEFENTIDSGGCILLSANRETVGSINVLISTDKNTGIKCTEAIGVACFDTDGNSFSVQNTPELDPQKGSLVVYKKNADLNTLLTELSKIRKKWKKKVIQFDDWGSLRDLAQKVDTERFIYRRDVRKVFVEITSNEPSHVEKNKEIEKFWQWFSSNQAMLLSMKAGDENINKIISQVGKKLGKVGPLAHEFCLLDKDGRRDFIVSANGIKENIPLVEQLVNAAPNFSGWNIIKYKPRKGFDEISIGPMKFSKNNVKYTFKKSDKLDVTLYFEEFKEYFEKLYAQLVFIILDGVLGEYAVMTKIGEVAWESMDNAPADAKSVADMAADFDQMT